MLAIFLMTSGFAVLFVDLLGAGGLVAPRGAFFLSLSQFLMIVLAMFHRIILVAIDEAGNNTTPRQRK